MAWESEAEQRKSEAPLGKLLLVVFLALIVSCALADRREKELLGRLCARGDTSACIELDNIREADAEAAREGPY